MNTKPLEDLPWAGDLLREGSNDKPQPVVRVRVTGASYWGNDEDIGKLGTARYSRGGVTIWVELDDGTSTQFDIDDLEVIEDTAD